MCRISSLSLLSRICPLLVPRPVSRLAQSAFDPAAGEDVYEPELIVAERLAKGVTQYHVK